MLQSGKTIIVVWVQSFWDLNIIFWNCIHWQGMLQGTQLLVACNAPRETLYRVINRKKNFLLLFFVCSLFMSWDNSLWHHSPCSAVFQKKENLWAPPWVETFLFEHVCWDVLCVSTQDWQWALVISKLSSLISKLSSPTLRCEHNVTDSSSALQENSHLALCYQTKHSGVIK